MTKQLGEGKEDKDPTCKSKGRPKKASKHCKAVSTDIPHDLPSDVSEKTLMVPRTREATPVVDNLDDQFHAFLATPGLSEHRLIGLTQYSMLRACVHNAIVLDLDFGFLINDDSSSPWTLSSPFPAIAPQDLGPTHTQLSTPHHPYLDIIAPPSFRDNVLLSCLSEELEDQLCYELHLDSFTVWGSQPWNATGTFIQHPACAYANNQRRSLGSSSVVCDGLVVAVGRGYNTSDQFLARRKRRGAVEHS